ncbi:hypothetical protein KIN20_011032 [Parelaphostrongylus tenuis]|uniref:Uncharacterized protein n=1 Tax=Parelaphostrongylus tenuis TaxID=148309 RepID=A0AAD5MRI9_PARTN|nr:hypothetical protein KIN20_011032 [Parelaphostrongylus tenuis]
MTVWLLLVLTDFLAKLTRTSKSKRVKYSHQDSHVEVASCCENEKNEVTAADDLKAQEIKKEISEQDGGKEDFEGVSGFKMENIDEEEETDAVGDSENKEQSDS